LKERTWWTTIASCLERNDQQRFEFKCNDQASAAEFGLNRKQATTISQFCSLLHGGHMGIRWVAGEHRTNLSTMPRGLYFDLVTACRCPISTLEDALLEQLFEGLPFDQR